MNLQAIRTRLEDLYGPTNTSELEYYDRLINDVYNELCSITTWWWLEREVVITTTGYAKSSTVSATNGSSVLTPDSSGEWLDDYEQGWVSDGSRVYRILDSSNSIGDIKLDSDWIGDTDTEASVNFWRDIFQLPTDFSDLVSVLPRSYPGKKPLQVVSPHQIDAETPQIYHQATEHAIKCCVYRETDKDVYYHLRIYPPPDQEVEYVVRYICLPSDLSSSDDEALIPSRYHNVISDMAKLKLLKDRREDPDVIQNAEIEAQKGLSRLWKAQKRSKAQTWVFGKRMTKHARMLSYKPVNVNSESP